MPLSVNVDVAGGVTVLRVTGELDAATCDIPVTAARRLLADAAPPRLDVDLAAVTFLGSSGIGAFVRIRNLCHETGVDLRLRGVRPQARKLLMLTGLDGSFAVAADTPS